MRFVDIDAARRSKPFLLSRAFMILATFALVAQRTEHLTTDQTVGGSNPSKRAVSLVKLVITPGCDPGDRGFKSRMTPSK